MRVYVFPADLYGCGYYRLIWASRALINAGHEVVVVEPKDRAHALWARTDADGKQIVDVGYPPDADVIVLQRITHIRLVEAIKVMRKRGLAVVIDMDDDLATIDPRNPAFRAMHPTHGMSAEHNWQNTQRACEAATYVTVSTPALLPRYAPHGRGEVLFNCVPESYLKIERADSAVVGWGGSVHSHPGDLQEVGPAIASLIREGMHFRIVGPVSGTRAALGLSEDPEATGGRDMLTEWPQALAELGVGIAPLADTRFNSAKSWLKPLEYAALGVVPVMSPRAEYRRIHESGGVGALAAKPRQWMSKIRELVQDSSRRAELSAAGREFAAGQTIERNAWRWWSAWEQAFKLQQES
jgi:hypothetical protein